MGARASELLAAPFAAWREVLESCAGPAEDGRAAVRRGGLPVPARELTDDDPRALWLSG